MPSCHYWIAFNQAAKACIRHPPPRRVNGAVQINEIEHGNSLTPNVQILRMMKDAAKYTEKRQTYQEKNMTCCSSGMYSYVI